MNLTKSKLMQIIKEEVNEYNREDTLTPEQQKVVSLINNLVAAIRTMGKSDPAMTDDYQMLFRSLEEAGVNTAYVAKMV